jgi:hypothetical protein
VNTGSSRAVDRHPPRQLGYFFALRCSEVRNGWSSPQMLARYGASARSARARRTYDRSMTGNP